MWAALLIAPGAALCQAPGVITTGYLPSRDLASITNEKGRGDALEGMCEGHQQLSEAVFRYRQTHTSVKPLNDITSDIRAKSGEQYLRRFMNLATDLAAAEGVELYNPNRAAGRNAASFGDEVANTLRGSQMPQGVLFKQADGVLHRMTVYGAIPTSNGWELRVADSNVANDPNSRLRAMADKVTLRYQPGPFGRDGVWVTYVDGKPTRQVYPGGGDLIRNPRNVDKQFMKLVEMGLQGKTEKQIQKELKFGPYKVDRDLSQGATIIRKDAVGGIIIQFDPNLLRNVASEEKLRDLGNRIAKFMATEEAGMQILNLADRSVQLDLVPLSDLKPGQHLGKLERIRGFVVRPDGKVFLAGQSGPKPLSVDHLIVAVRSIYQEGNTPFISLDPDPADFSGPQRVRVGGLEKSLQNTDFVLSMLEADYVMKKINLGRLKAKYPAFTPWVTMFDRQQRDAGIRMWMEPAPPPLADAMVYKTEDGGSAAYFESEVRALSEQMLMVQRFSQEAGPPDSIGDAAAQEMTNAFERLAQEFPEYRKLQGVFDLAKACMAMRSLGVKSPDLDRLATLTPTSVAIPKTYPGIGPDVTPSGGVVSGGAIAKAKFNANFAVWTQALAPLINAAGSLPSAQVVLPASISVEEARLAGHTADLLIRRARSAYRDGDADSALKLIESVSQLAPNDDLRVMYAAILIAQNRPDEGIEKLGGLPEFDVVALALRSIALADSGNAKEALLDAAKLEDLAPLDELALIMAATARMMCFDFDGAKRDVDAARLLAPVSRLLDPISKQLRFARAVGVDEAKRRQQAARSLPFSLRQRMIRSAMDPHDAIVASRSILSDLDSGALVVAPELAIRERAEADLALRLLVTGSTEEARIMAAKCLDRHPDWPSTRFISALIGFETGAAMKNIVSDLELASSLPDDPFMGDLRAIYGIANPVLLGAFTMALDPKRTAPDRMLLANFLESVAPGPDAMLAKQLVSFKSGDAAKYIHTRGAEGLGTSTSSRDSAIQLARMVPTSLKTHYPTFVAGLALVQLGMSRSDLPPEIEREFRAKSLVMLSAHSLVDFQDGDQVNRSATAILCATSIMQRTINPSHPGVKAMEAIGEETKKLLKANPKAVKAAQLKAFAKSFDSRFQKFWSGTTQGIRSELAFIPDTRARDRIEILVTWFIQDLIRVMPVEIKQLETRYPVLQKMPEWKGVKTTFGRMSSGRIGALSEPQLWSKVLSDLKTRQDAVDFEGALRLLCEKNSKPNPNLMKHQFHLQMKARRMD